MRVTEASNPHTRTIDQAETGTCITQIAAADSELFGSGWGKGLLDPDFLENSLSLRRRLSGILAHPKGRVLLAGAGTSGRLAVVAGLDHPSGKVKGLLAGGMEAFFKAKEGVEDAPKSGWHTLAEHIPEDGPWAYIGITCGLSAAWVAGQVADSVQHGAQAVAVIGFNPLEAANRRDLGDGRNFWQILNILQQLDHGYLLNPIVGPEPITGSTRMKGGSATLMILQLLLYHDEPQALLDAYRELQTQVYTQMQNFAPLMDGAAQVFKDSGDLLYLSQGKAARLALLDASECPPTFGARPTQVSCFVDDQFATVLPGFDTRGFTRDDFANQKSARDLVVTVDFHEGDLHIPASIQTWLESQPESLREPLQTMALKWLLNGLSTCAFIRYGKVHGNKMIDVRISNLKLWERATGIVAEIAHKSQAEADAALREVVAQAAGANMELPALITLASQQERVVPRAIALLS